MTIKSLVRTFIGLKVNHVWPHAACIILYGWRDGQRQWKGERA